MATAVETLFPEHSEVRDGRLSIGGCDAIELARRFGTPLYAVSEDDLRARAREFTAAMPREGSRSRKRSSQPSVVNQSRIATAGALSRLE